MSDQVDIRHMVIVVCPHEWTYDYSHADIRLFKSNFVKNNVNYAQKKGVNTMILPKFYIPKLH